MPVDGVTSDQLTRQFTDPRGGTREHEAIDILAPRNTPVRLWRTARSRGSSSAKPAASPSTSSTRPQRYCYYYAHLERYAAVCARVNPSTRVKSSGYVGTSGNAPKDTPHLHFAVFRLTAEKHWWEGTAHRPIRHPPLTRSNLSGPEGRPSWCRRGACER